MRALEFTGLVVVGAIVLQGCVVPAPKAALDPGGPPYVAVLSGQMPPPIDRVARHAWIVTHHGAATRFRRFEMGSDSETDPFKDFAAGDVMLHGTVVMSDEALTDVEACFDRARQDYYHEHPDYFPIPGPNSNTFVASLLKACNVDIELPATAIGRDYVGPVGASLTEGGTGFVVGTIPLSLRLGLQEGAEVGLFGLPLGVHAWPPGLTVPVNPGRIGFASDEHRDKPFRRHGSDEPEPAKRGAGDVALLARGAAAARSAGAGGFGQSLTVGLAARVFYGGRVAYGVGLDFDLGAAAPLAFAGSAHLFPMGVGYILGSTGYVGFFSGIGTSGVTRGVPAGFEFPEEFRLALDVGRSLRLSFVATGVFIAGQPLRRQGRFGFDELRLGTYARFGRLSAQHHFNFGSGTYVGLERRELMGTSVLGFVLGTEIDAGM